MTVSSLRADAADLPATFPAARPEDLHANEAKDLLGEATGSYGVLSGENFSSSTLVAAAQVEATLAHAAATARLADATESIARSTRRTS